VDAFSLYTFWQLHLGPKAGINVLARQRRGNRRRIGGRRRAKRRGGLSWRGTGGVRNMKGLVKCARRIYSSWRCCRPSHHYRSARDDAWRPAVLAPCVPGDRHERRAVEGVGFWGAACASTLHICAARSHTTDGAGAAGKAAPRAINFNFDDSACWRGIPRCPPDSLTRKLSSVARTRRGPQSLPITNATLASKPAPGFLGVWVRASKIPWQPPPSLPGIHV